jgi:hypothetical protein
MSRLRRIGRFLSAKVGRFVPWFESGGTVWFFLVPTIAESRVVIRGGNENDPPGDRDHPDG